MLDHHPKAILFACNMNSIRSPMAEALAAKHLGRGFDVASCGVYPGMIDPFLPGVLAEVDAEVPITGPQTFANVDLKRFDLVIALTPEAAAEVRRVRADVEYWDVENPTDTRGSEHDVREAYRRCRIELQAKIDERFRAV